jgi:hypothetical protein
MISSPIRWTCMLFLFKTIMNSNSINIHLPAFWCTYILRSKISGYSAFKGPALRDTAKYFSKVVAAIYITAKSAGGFLFLHIFRKTQQCCIFKFSYSAKAAVVPTSCYWLPMRLSLFQYVHLIIWIFSFVNCLFIKLRLRTALRYSMLYKTTVFRLCLALSNSILQNSNLFYFEYQCQGRVTLHLASACKQ